MVKEIPGRDTAGIEPAKTAVDAILSHALNEANGGSALSDNSTDPELESILDEFAIDGVNLKNLQAWIECYPEHKAALTDFFCQWKAMSFIDAEAIGTPAEVLGAALDDGKAFARRRLKSVGL